MRVEWVFIHDLYQSNPVFDTEHDIRITVPVVRVEALREELDKLLGIIPCVHYCYPCVCFTAEITKLLAALKEPS